MQILHTVPIAIHSASSSCSYVHRYLNLHLLQHLVEGVGGAPRDGAEAGGGDEKGVHTLKEEGEADERTVDADLVPRPPAVAELDGEWRGDRGSGGSGWRVGRDGEDL